MTYNSSTQFDSYVPVYDAIPDDWPMAKKFLTERLREHANAINLRAIGWMLDEELLSGFQFIQPRNYTGTSEQNRSVFRKVLVDNPLILGVNNVPHGITFDTNFTLIDLWVAGTNSVTMEALIISGNDVLMNSMDIVITSPQAFDRSVINILYTLEL